MRIVEKQDRQKERARHAIEMERRKIEVQDEAWKMFQKLREWVNQVLRFPLQDVISADGQTIIKAARRDFNTLHRLVEAIVKLAAIAVPAPDPEARINIPQLRPSLRVKYVDKFGPDLFRYLPVAIVRYSQV